MEVSFKRTPAESRLIHKIAVRASRAARKVGIDYEVIDASMDLAACHANGCPLDLARLAGADDFNFNHDVFGIRAKIDRTTGRLTDCFVPRCARRGEIRVAA